MTNTLREQVARQLELAMKESADLKSQAALARRSGIGQTTIGRILRCEVDAQIDTLNTLAKSLGKNVSDFTGGAYHSQINEKAAPYQANTYQAAQISKAQKALLERLQALFEKGDLTDADVNSIRGYIAALLSNK